MFAIRGQGSNLNYFWRHFTKDPLLAGNFLGLILDFDLFLWKFLTDYLSMQSLDCLWCPEHLYPLSHFMKFQQSKRVNQFPLIHLVSLPF